MPSEVKAESATAVPSKASTKVSMTSSNPEMKKKKKKGRIKRLSGLITGESRREKKARKEAERAAAGKPPPKADDEEESVYGIDVDDMSIASETPRASTRTRTAPASPPSNLLGGPKTDDLADKELTFLSPKVTPALQVILLLMDPKTRRFELLQLEFDSNKALVSDVIAQIPMSVTEEQLRLQQYDGVCDRGGMEMIKTMRLSEFCKTNEVVLAIPSGMSPSECARLARPILSDDGVISMLRASGINTDPVPVPPAEAREVELSEEVVEKTVAPEATGVWISVIIIAIIAIVLQGTQMYITEPLRPGSVLQPGMWMSKCGLLSAIPICENAGLEMKEDGVLTLYGSDGSVQWKLQGGKCRAQNTECEPGLVVKDDGNLVIGGKPITSVTIKGDAPLSPWPFEREPKLRVVRK